MLSKPNEMGDPSDQQAAMEGSAFESTADSLTDPKLMRAELERLLARERQIAALLGSKSPDRILHDLRNLLNEVQLLRILTEDKM